MNTPEIIVSVMVIAANLGAATGCVISARKITADTPEATPVVRKQAPATVKPGRALGQVTHN